MKQFSNEEIDKLIDLLDFSKIEGGLLPVITQDSQTKDVLMVAFANEEAVRKTLQTGYAHYYSRSRNLLWKKGETSGHVQKVKEILIDCDEDTLLIKVEQKTASCHEGYRSCFFRKLDADGNLKIIEEKVFEPKDVYPRTSPDVASGRCGVSPSKKKV